MRPTRGSRTSTNSSTDASKSSRSKGGLNDASKKTVRSNSNPNKSRRPGKDKNKEIVDIQPLVYSFRVPSNPSPGAVMNALLPPYWLYHDHAFGVIWMLFHPDKKYIGIAQLHWCLRFLLDLKNTEGEYTGDVNICIQAVQDDLIEQYANLGTALENQESPNGKSKDPGAENNKNDQDNADKRENKAEAASGEKESLESRNEDKEGKESASSRVLRSQQTKLSGLSLCSTVDENAYVTAQSLTYNEMVSRGPAPYTEQTPLEQIYKAGTSGANPPTSVPDIAAMLKTDTSPPDIPLTEMGTKELVNFLNSSRKEHVERIKKEIERLYDLEKFMEGMDKQRFKAYVTDDLARRLDKLDGQGVVREVDTMLR